MAFIDRFRRRPSIPMPVLITDPAMGDADIAAMRDLAVASGDWKPAAAYLEGLEPAAHDRRHMAVDALADAALRSPAWFEAWRRDRPDAPDMLAVRAEILVKKAWEARGAGRAEDTGRDAFAEFFRILEQADRACRAATDAAPAHDAVPWVTWLNAARGQQLERAVFDRRWAALKERQPQSRAGHYAALQFLCEKWFGSHEEMFAFARAAAAEAPVGATTKLLPVQAHVEYVLQATHRDESFSRGTYWNSPAVREELLAAQAAWEARSEPGPTDLYEYSLLAYAQAQSGRWRETGALFAAAGHRVFHRPWWYMPDAYLGLVHERVAKDR
ncbi:hypothetical protein [Yinghuangia soli]|uniref:DUF4034 domain-containing protein n=1 Tax=Yinghuangia soli TaxID=2908204 RepID=A0AA41PVV1_9ACTN|nr:hypothetical protein [Yinghuangia soli]MCF2526646.1 hypothetical protein [Yinghuangia soli]